MASIHQQPSGSWRVTWRDPAGRSERDTSRPSGKRGHSKRRSSWTWPGAATWTATLRTGCCSGLRPAVARRPIGGAGTSRCCGFTCCRGGATGRSRRSITQVSSSGSPSWGGSSRRPRFGSATGCCRWCCVRLSRRLGYNPCEGVRLPPRRRQEEPATLTRADVTGRLLPETPDRYRALVATAAYTGLHWAECAGLHWSAVDLSARRLRVVRVLVEVRGQITPKPYPKSKAGRRTVPVPAPLVELLDAHRVAFPSLELVFTNSVGSPVGRTSFRTRVWKPAVRRAGLPERLASTTCGTRTRRRSSRTACRRTSCSGSWAMRT